MSVPVTREFLPALRELEGRLSAPIPERVRILRELEFDLEQLRARLTAGGLSAEEARARALEVLVPGRVALQQLDDLHAPVYRRLTRHVRDGRLRLLERTALALATASVLVFEGMLLARGGNLLVPPHLLWPVLVGAALLFSAITVNAFRLWVRGDHGRSPIGPGAILGFAGATLSVGLVGAFVDTYGVLGVLAAAPEAPEHLILGWLQRSAALLSLSIVIALAGALAWFVTTQWLAAVSAARKDALGFGPSNRPQGGAS